MFGFVIIFLKCFFLFLFVFVNNYIVFIIVICVDVYYVINIIIGKMCIIEVVKLF